MISENNLKKLKLNMETIESEKASLKLKKEQFEKDNEKTTSLIKKLVEEEKELKKELTIEAKKEYEETKLKKLSGGLGIRINENSILTYEDEKAFEWAKEHNLCLLLDKKVFNDIAKSQKLDFVKIDSESTISVTFPKKIKLEEKE